MKNVTALSDTKSQIESPKTPGGISKSLLTPCRRVGLSRKWKKAGPSPFMSPVATESTPVTSTVDEVTPSTSRKRSFADENNDNACVIGGISNTPKAVQLPKKRKSKRLLSDSDISSNLPQCNKDTVEDSKAKKLQGNPKDKTCDEPTNKSSDVPIEKSIKEKDVSPILSNEVSKPERKSSKSQKSTNKKSPNNLAKECFVVLQNKLLPNELKKLAKENERINTEKPSISSQALFDSDSDEAPLASVKRTKSAEKVKTVAQNDKIVTQEDKIKQINDDDDFVTNSKLQPRANVKKLEEKQTSTSGLKKDKKQKKPQKDVQTQSIQILSQDDDEDFDFTNKKTIIIRKTYEKVTKPSKAKSTGSITQKDIDELKARIEMKKNMLLSKALTEDTEELRTLIKKWRKGCQDALVELMQLMKSKFPDRQHMEYSEILKSLKIPSELVGYDSDNDTFASPDDANIILSRFK